MGVKYLGCHIIYDCTKHVNHQKIRSQMFRNVEEIMVLSRHHKPQLPLHFNISGIVGVS